jgi:hypothetical protein
MTGDISYNSQALNINSLEAKKFIKAREEEQSKLPAVKDCLLEGDPTLQ